VLSVRSPVEVGCRDAADAFRRFIDAARPARSTTCRSCTASAAERRLEEFGSTTSRATAGHGPRASANPAWRQRQFDVYGEPVELFSRWHSRGNPLDHDYWRFVQAFDTDALDAAVLLLPEFRFVSWDDERIVRTADAVRPELGEDGMILRYRMPRGQVGREGTFLADQQRHLALRRGVRHAVGRAARQLPAGPDHLARRGAPRQRLMRVSSAAATLVACPSTIALRPSRRTPRPRDRSSSACRSTTTTTA
jgi:hypothetical protein